MADTYYVYDALGKLRFVLPPALNGTMRSIVKPWDIRSCGALRRYAYFYRYDKRMLLVEKKLPGADPVYYINDITGTPVFCQDGNLRNVNRWKFSIPDRFGRPVLEGLCDAPDAAAVKQMFVHVYKTDYANTASSTCGTGYCPNIALKTPSLLTASYYDDYRFLALQQFKGLNRMGSRNARGLKTGAMTAVLEPITSQGDSANNTKTTPSEICSVVSYDSEDRIACVETSNILGGKDRTVTDYTFSGKPSSMAITHTASGRSTTEESYSYTYDALDRPLQTRYSINNGCSVTVADNQYDEFGRLQTDRRNGSASLATEYSYNIHGMPTRISTPLYTESLFYEQSHNGSTPQYGGNISAIDWSVADESDTYGQRGYIFSYDGMSRLTAAGYLENGKRNDHFSTSYKYDLMGNILSLRREGLLNSGNYGTIDDLTYSYKGNQVVKIDDAAEESPSYRGAMHFRDYADEETEYTYDANGNMLTDSNKGITSIDYNVLDLPQCISTKSRALFKEDSNDTIYYTYSADGTKLRSTYKKAEYRVYPYNPETSLTSFNVETGLNVGTVGMAKPIAKRLKTKYYYCSNLVYDNDNISAILFDGGYASVDDDNGIVMHFYVKDHLGSNRLVVDGNGNIEEVNHYYPFGALMGDRCGVSRNNYKYIGKELDTMYGWNMQDHEARWYDPVVGRWMVTDPLQEKYASFSTYCYAINNPLNILDSNGTDIVYVNLEGQEVYRIKNESIYKTYIQTSRSFTSPLEGNLGWKEVPMPKIIQTKPSSNENVSSEKYQKNDYLIAARTGYFNQAKNNGRLKMYSEGGNKIPSEEIRKIPDLDPTLVKAICIQESNAALTNSDIMTSNNPKDWGDGKMKSAYGLKKNEKLSVTNSLYYGIRILATKGYRGGVRYDNKTGKITYEFRGWGNATNNYNGGGVQNYQNDVETMVREAKPRE